MRPLLSAPLALAILAHALPALADEGVSDTVIEEAFAVGLGDGFVGDATLDIERHGRTLVLRGALAGGGEGGSLELTCMLCTADEAALSARTMGADLAERAGSGGNSPIDELPAAAEPEPRPLWIPTLLTGLGVAAMAAGTALLLLDGDCASTEIDRDRDCREVHDLAPAGWGTLSAGAVSLVTGVLLFFLFAGDAEPAGDEA